MTKVELIAAVRALDIEDDADIVVQLRNDADHNFEISVVEVGGHLYDYGVITVLT